MHNIHPRSRGSTVKTSYSTVTGVINVRKNRRLKIPSLNSHMVASSYIFFNFVAWDMLFACSCMTFTSDPRGQPVRCFDEQCLRKIITRIIVSFKSLKDKIYQFLNNLTTIKFFVRNIV